MYHDIMSILVGIKQNATLDKLHSEHNVFFPKSKSPRSCAISPITTGTADLFAIPLLIRICSNDESYGVYIT